MKEIELELGLVLVEIEREESIQEKFAKLNIKLDEVLRRIEARRKAKAS